MDRHVIDKHRNKIEKYLDLAIELQTLWNTRFEIIPLIFEGTYTLHESTIQSFKFLQLNDINICQLMKTVKLQLYNLRGSQVLVELNSCTYYY